jgi:hypothetical protein
MPPSRPNPRRRFITDLDEIHGVPRISRTAPLLDQRQPSGPMSALGQKWTFWDICVTSALPPKADIAGGQLDVR